MCAHNIHVYNPPRSAQAFIKIFIIKYHEVKSQSCLLGNVMSVYV